VVTRPFGQKEPFVVDSCQGSPYDGGYTDLGVVGEMLNILCCHGNSQGGPCIRSALIPLYSPGGEQR